ncbi:thioredoxin domain-containing protein, partial [Streptomyces albus]
MNRLAGMTSPYLLQHADNPVDWWPWSPEAFEEARRRQVPVLLSVGYASCHWCHVMARESFEDEATARVMNAHFVSVKVDREERPDVDAVYMEAVQAATGQGGWPMTVFLTPDAEPFYFGTYFPPAPRHGMPSFRQVLEGVRTAWQDRRDEVADVASRISADLAGRSIRLGAPQPPGAEEMGA